MPYKLPTSTFGNYRIISPHLGSGSFGTISLGEHIQTHELVAVKTVPDSDWDECEYQCLSALSHPNILRVRGHFHMEQQHHLITDYAAGGDLFDFLEGKPRIDEDTARLFFSQIVSCIEYVHRSGYAHRDLKLENIFLDKDRKKAIIGDWGFATPWKQDSPITERCGTLFYLAPEMISGAGYLGPEVDMWSLGVLLYYLLVGNLPFDAGANHETEQLIRKAQPHIPHYLSKDARHLLQSLLCPLHSRLTSFEALSHPWLQPFPSSASSSSSSSSSTSSSISQFLESENFAKRAFYTRESELNQSAQKRLRPIQNSTDIAFFEPLEPLNPGISSLPFEDFTYPCSYDRRMDPCLPTTDPVF